MSLSDPIADMLTRIRNALIAGHARVDIPCSRLKEQLCQVLEREGFVEEFERIDDGKQGVLRVSLRYTEDGEPVIQGIQRRSKLSLRYHVRCTDIKPVRSGLGISILTTSRGVMTGKQARQERVGGEVLCEVW